MREERAPVSFFVGWRLIHRIADADHNSVGKLPAKETQHITIRAPKKYPDITPIAAAFSRFRTVRRFSSLVVGHSDFDGYPDRRYTSLKTGGTDA